MPLSMGDLDRLIREVYEPGLREGLLDALMFGWMLDGVPSARAHVARAAFDRLSTHTLLDVCQIRNARMMNAVLGHLRESRHPETN